MWTSGVHVFFSTYTHIRNRSATSKSEKIQGPVRGHMQNHHSAEFFLLPFLDPEKWHVFHTKNVVGFCHHLLSITSLKHIFKSFNWKSTSDIPDRFHHLWHLGMLSQSSEKAHGHLQAVSHHQTSASLRKERHANYEFKSQYITTQYISMFIMFNSNNNI